MPHDINARAFAKAVLTHYDSHARDLPWRGIRDPYKIWLSEIMLQQTTIATVTPYYHTFLEHFPTVNALASAKLDDVLSLWQGLGYYSRARNLHACAQHIVTAHGGHFPTTEKDLLTLPGIGPYTAAAIASIAFNEAATVVDGNVERVISRLYTHATPLPKAKKELYTLAQPLTPATRPGDYAGAMMDIGSTICTPKNPACSTCPLRTFCRAYQHGTQTDYPKKTPKKKNPHYTGHAYCLRDSNGRIFLRKRPEQGLLAHLWETPTTGWEDTKIPSTIQNLIDTHPHSEMGVIKHVFSHFSLELEVIRVDLDDEQPTWHNPANLPALSTLMKKVITQADI